MVGWYDDKKKEWNEGIDTKLDKIGDALEQNIANQLVDIDRVLNEIERLLGDIGETLGKFSYISSDIVVPKIDGANKTVERLYGLCALFCFLTSIGIFAILGTVRHWF